MAGKPVPGVCQQQPETPRKPRLEARLSDGAHLQDTAEDLGSLRGSEHPLWVAQRAVSGNDGEEKGRETDHRGPELRWRSDCRVDKKRGK